MDFPCSRRRSLTGHILLFKKKKNIDRVNFGSLNRRKFSTKKQVFSGQKFLVIRLWETFLGAGTTQKVTSANREVGIITQSPKRRLYFALKGLRPLSHNEFDRQKAWSCTFKFSLNKRANPTYTKRRPMKCYHRTGLLSVLFHLKSLRAAHMMKWRKQWVVCGIWFCADFNT